MKNSSVWCCRYILPALGCISHSALVLQLQAILVPWWRLKHSVEMFTRFSDLKVYQNSLLFMQPTEKQLLWGHTLSKLHWECRYGLHLELKRLTNYIMPCFNKVPKAWNTDSDLATTGYGMYGNFGSFHFPKIALHMCELCPSWITDFYGLLPHTWVCGCMRVCGCMQVCRCECVGVSMCVCVC